MSKKAKRAIEMKYGVVLDLKYRTYHAVRFDRKKAACGADVFQYGTKIGENARLCKKCAPIVASAELASIRSQIDRCQQAIKFLQQALITL